VFKSLPNDSRDAFQKTARISIRALIEAEGLLVQVTEQMERLNTNVSPANAALEQTPKVFQSVRMNVAASVGFGMVNDIVNVIRGKAIVGTQRIRMHLRANLNALANMGLKFWPANSFHNFQRYAGRFLFRSSLQQSEHGGLAFNSGAFGLALPFVHVSSLSADESFIHFNVASKLANGAVLNRKADSVEHKPSGLLRDPESATQFAGTNAVLRVDDHPKGRKPFVKAKRAFLKNGS